MGTYKNKKRVTITWVTIFISLSVLSVLLIYFMKSFLPLVPAVSFLILTIGFSLSNTTIIATEDGIKKLVFNKVQQECKWIWIHQIKTIRSTSTGDYTTMLYWAKEPQYRGTGGLLWSIKKDPKSGTFIVTWHLANYVGLLKEIREKAIYAEIDSTTEKIISKGI